MIFSARDQYKPLEYLSPHDQLMLRADLREPRCGNCRFFDAIEPPIARELMEDGRWVIDWTGFCRRNPPTVVQVNLPMDLASVGCGEWPEVECRSWCGEFKTIEIPTIP